MTTPSSSDADAVLATYDGLNVLVNNAGTTWGAPLADYPSSAFDKVLAVNVTAVFDLTRRLLPALTRAAKPDDPARVINIGSVDGIRVPPMESGSASPRWRATPTRAARLRCTR